jgi:UDP-N-acetylglucosamine 2-epimerase (non-hydrolysing)
MKIVLVVGARPNFMKIAPILKTIAHHNTARAGIGHIEPILVHTGQHYDYEMSRVFFQELELPEPDIYLGVGSGTHAEQTAKVMVELEKLLLSRRPDIVLVVGDVNSTLGAALAAVKLNIPVAHVEAGLRSYDRKMPEEINRMLTDAISEYLFTPSPDADENLKKEGIPEEKIFLVGNVMVDSLLANKEKAVMSDIRSRLKLDNIDYALLTLHRAENVDDENNLTNLGHILREISQTLPIVFPAHPRTKNNIKRFRLEGLFGQLNATEKKSSPDTRLRIINPLGYLDFLNLMMNCKFVLTDSGGIQEETTVLGIPCLTLRGNTERPITITQGTNFLVGGDIEKTTAAASEILNGRWKQGTCPKLWDGKTAERIVGILTGNPQ